MDLINKDVNKEMFEMLIQGCRSKGKIHLYRIWMFIPVQENTGSLPKTIKTVFRQEIYL